MLYSCMFQTAETDNTSAESELLLTNIRKRYLLNKHVIANVSFELAEYLNAKSSQTLSIFVNKKNQLNVVDLVTGSALYSLEPLIDCETEVSSFVAQAPYFSLSNKAGTESNLQRADVLLVFGLGLGYALQNILENLDVKFLILYEPRTELLNCSAHAIDWQRLLDIAERRGIYLGLQIGNTGSSLSEHLSEILTLQPNIDRIHYYRHLSHPVSDEVIEYYNNNSGDLNKLLKSNRQFIGFEKAADYIPIRTGVMLGNHSPQPYGAGHELFSKNLTALSKYFPELARFYSNYQAERWQLVLDENSLPNLYQINRHCMLYQNIQDDSATLTQFFFEKKIKANTQVRQLAPYKLRHYTHYKAISKLQAIEQQFTTALQTDPELLSSIVIGGCSVSLPLDELICRANLKNIFVFEPEPDFFYASLFLLPWHTFLEKMDSTGRHLYLNVGGSPAGYFDEILRQFYRVGAYALAESCFWLNYVTPELNATFHLLQKQLRSVLALGDYFDHAKYGLNHTLSNMAADSLFMKNSQLCSRLAELPVFIIGNGPSLDQTVEYIRALKEQAIILSCGTAIKPLLDYGIVPDFHVEIEQNASTYDHLKSSCDIELLKCISLISFSSIHPATRALFKQSFLVFKESEAPTIVLKKEAENILQQSLKMISYAFPTASNMALSFILSLGHKQIYLFGVDFGQADPAYHHSKKSIYYTKSGEETYDYGKSNPEQIRVKGNFRDIIYTKSEFDLARKVCEMQLVDYRQQTEVYNCSDGAFIKGTISLIPDNILLSATVIEKTGYLNTLKEKYFIETHYLQPLLSIFGQTLLSFKEKTAVLVWRDMLKTKISSVHEAKEFVASQWSYFENEVTTSKVVFCLYYSSVSYFFSRFTALLNVNDTILSLEDKLFNFNAMLTIFIDFLTESINSIKDNELECCTAILFSTPVDF